MHLRRMLTALFVLLAAAAAGHATAQVIPSDPLFSAQGYLSAINAPQAWEVERGNPDIVVAILSSGVDPGHRDLTSNLWRSGSNSDPGCGMGVLGCNFSSPPDPSGTGDCVSTTRVPLPNSDIRDDTGSGTHLAGIVAAAANNGYGISGVAPNVRLMTLKVSSCTGPTPAALASGIAYAVRQGARVLLLDSTPDRTGACPTAAVAVRDAIDAAVRGGAIVVTGTGDPSSACQPAFGAGDVILVAAADLGVGGVVTRSILSNDRAGATIAAPGSAIVGPVPATGCRLCDASGFRAISGTAQSAALVAGAAALLLSRDPLLGPAEVRELLAQGATAIGQNQQWAGAGLLNVRRSLDQTPSSVSGRLLRDGRDAEGEFTIQVLIGATRCGETAVRSEGGRTRYVVHVPPASVRPGCGTAGAVMSFQMDGATVGLLPWQPGARSVDITVPAAPPPVSQPPPTAEPTPTSPAAPASPAPSPDATMPIRPALVSADALVGRMSESGAELLGIRVTNSVNDDWSEPGASMQVFRADDGQVIVWTRWGGPREERTLVFIWGRPDGTIFRQSESMGECPCHAISRWPFDRPGPSGGDLITDHAGVWQVDIYVDDEYLGAIQFLVE
jgi:hypothetical protein